MDHRACTCVSPTLTLSTNADADTYTHARAYTYGSLCKDRRGGVARPEVKERNVRACKWSGSVSFRRPRNNAQRTGRLFSRFLLFSARSLPRRKTRKFSERERNACVRAYEPLIVRTFLGQGSWIFF